MISQYRCCAAWDHGPRISPISFQEILAARAATTGTCTPPAIKLANLPTIACFGGRPASPSEARAPARKAGYGATTERTVLSDVPWIPSEMKEVAQIDIGCRE